MTHDVIIVGAGPAGAAAGYWLGEAGCRAVVLEKRTLPRYKPCGGGVPKAVLDRFPFDLSPVVERWIRRVRFRFSDGREAVARLPDCPIAMVMRDRFDLRMIDHVQAKVRENAYVVALEQEATGVAVTTASGETLRARYLIGADGASSRVSWLAGLRRGRQMGVAMEAEAPVTEDLLEEYQDTALFVFGTPPNGYLWVFPKAEHLSVGIGTFQGRASNIKHLLQTEMAKLGIHIDGVRLRGHPLPVHLKHEPLHRGRVLLTGDAAGLMDPLLGEGIRHAVDSGRLAAESVLNDDPASYSRQVHQKIGRDLLWGRWWAHLFYRYPRASFELAVRNPRFVSDFLRLFVGETSYRRMTLRAVPNVLLGFSGRLPASRRAV